MEPETPFTLFIFIVLIFSGLFISVAYHEDAHRVVLQNTGHKNVSISISIIGGVTRGFADSYTDTETSRDYNMMTDIIGYHLIAFTFNLWMIALFVIIAIALMVRRE